MVDSHVGGSLDVGDDGGYLFGDVATFGDVVGVDFESKVTVGTGNLVHDHVDDRLRESSGVAGHFLDGGSHVLDKLGFGTAAFPSVVGLETHACFDMGEGEAFGTFVIATELGHDVGGFVEFFQHMAEVVGHFLGFLEGKAGG